MSLDAITSFLGNFDLSAFVPDFAVFLEQLELIVRICVLVGPLVLLGLGLWYFFIPPKEANHKAGFRTFFGMGSVEAWQYTQRLAGTFWAVLGIVLTVVMGLICNSFRGAEAMTMVRGAAICLLAELGLVIATYITINVMVYRHYDRHGNCRSK